MALKFLYGAFKNNRNS